VWPATEVKQLPPVRVAYVVRQGPYDNLAEVFSELCARVKAQGMAVVGPPVLVYRSHPEGVPPAFREWELQLPVAGEATGGEEDALPVKELPARVVVATGSRGGYTTVGGLLPALFQVVYSRGYRLAGPAEEVYPVDFPRVPLTEVLTEVRFPVAVR